LRAATDTAAGRVEPHKAARLDPDAEEFPMSRSSTRCLIALAITASLFATAAVAQRPAQGPESEGRQAQMQAHREARHADLLQRFDSDASGSLSQTEIDAAAAAHAAEVDANGDGLIATEELQAFRDARRAEAQAARQQRQRQKMDANTDGSLSTEEFASAHAQRLQRMDRNGDGVIEADELARPARQDGPRHGPRGG
jgi:Ca2+-binding EF-hand superfamily protein